MESRNLLTQHRPLFVYALLLALFSAEQIRHFLQFEINLHSAFRTAFMRLVELEYVHLQGMQTLLQFVTCSAQRGDLYFNGLIVLFGFSDLLPGIFRGAVLLG